MVQWLLEECGVSADCGDHVRSLFDPRAPYVGAVACFTCWWQHGTYAIFIALAFGSLKLAELLKAHGAFVDAVARVSEDLVVW